MKETQLASVCGFKRPNSASADASLHQQVTAVTVNLSHSCGVLQRPLPEGGIHAAAKTRRNNRTEA